MKSEARNPKFDPLRLVARRPKPEIQRKRSNTLSFGFRPSDFFRISPFGFRILVLFVLATSASAQTPLSNLVFTVGTTARDTANNDWSYLVIDSPSPGILVGKRFAVYGKPGFPTNAGTFTARGTIAPASDVATINSRLNQSVGLGQNLISLSNSLNGLLRKIPGITNQTIAQKVFTGFQASSGSAAIAEALFLMEKANPGLRLCSGHAFSEPLPVATTYELREIDALSGSPGDVAGRITLVPNSPVVLPAPGQPYQVMTNDPSDHLLIRLRWGAPNELRRLALLQFGYNVWRIPRAAAEAGNFHISPPSPVQLYSNPNFTRANVASAVMARKDYIYNPPKVGADDPNDRTTYFFADNGRANTGTNFTAGQEFYYFITARDLLGRDGLVSTGRVMRACWRLPPAPPGELHVENTVLPGSTNQPRLLLVWEQNTNATDRVSEYWVYRWANATYALTNQFTPLSNRVGVVSQVSGTNLNYFMDNSPGALTQPNASNVWYTVRAVSTASCDPLYSAQAGPAWGVLRERSAPDSTTGEILGSCGTPAVKLSSVTTNLFVSTNNEGPRSRIICTRRDPGIDWAEIFIGSGSYYFERIYFPPDSDRIEIEHAEPINSTLNFYASCKVGNAYGSESDTAIYTRTNFYGTNQEIQVDFLAGQLLANSFSSADPFASISNCALASTEIVDPTGMVGLGFGFPPFTTALIQAQNNDGAWVDATVLTSDSNALHWVSYPGCLLSPVVFRGCLVNLPVTDCEQHVVGAEDDGATSPIRIRFKLRPRTREYRVYRRVDSGPLTFLAQGTATYNSSRPNMLIEVKDEAMPSVAARLCYFVQLLDEHGNGGPMSFIGCKQVKPRRLPVPVLSEPSAAGDANQPQVALTWFCPTSGVYRFQIKLQVADSQGGAQPSGFAGLKLTRDLLFNTSALYAGLTSKRAAISTLKSVGTKAYLKFDEAHLTAPIGANFGPGPQFTLTANVRANTSYLISVAAVDEQGKVGPSSAPWAFTWRPPIALQNVPWPARPLPHVEAITFPAALTSNTNLYPKYPVGIVIGGGRSTSYDYIYGQTNLEYIPVQPPSRVLTTAVAGRTALPCVLYRTQVTNALFPRVSGDISQVSPLIESIAWYNPCLHGTFDGPCNYSLIRDPLIRAEYYQFIFGDSYYWGFNLYLFDTQPVISGARYRYFLVHFDSQREPDTIFPCGEVEIP